MPHQPVIPNQLPDLPSPTTLPWSAEITQAYQGLQSGYRASKAAINLDESDPIRLGHHLHQAKAVMVPIVEALESHHSNPLPHAFIKGVR